MDPVRMAAGAGRETETMACQRGRAQWLRYAYAAIVAEIALLSCWLPRDRALWRTVEQLGQPARRAKHARELRDMMKKDPSIGRRMLMPVSAPLRTALSYGAGAEPAVLVFVGSCTSCALGQMGDWSDAVGPRGSKSIAIISRDRPERIAAFVRSERFQLPIIADPTGELAASFNAIWLPRAYALSRSGTLLWLQKDDRMSASVIANALWDTEGR
jgi:hypothetical protein